MRYQALFNRVAFKRTLVSVALVAAYAGAWALPVFTFTPAGAGLTGAAVTADNVLLSDFSAVTFTGATTFSDSGLLSITGFQLGGSNVGAAGLNDTYSLYFQFTGTGHLTLGTASTDPRTTVTAGEFDTLSYTLVGASGNVTFGFSGNTPTATGGGATQTLASGTLVNGNVVTTPANGGTAFVPSAAATVSFAVAAGKEGFFLPNPFYTAAFTAFTNAITTVEPFGAGGVGSGFRINNGGGNLNFASPIPEPGTYALMFAGLGLVGFVAARRSYRA
jgi:hypothetical protein